VISPTSAPRSGSTPGEIVVPEAVEARYFQEARALPIEESKRVGILVGSRATVHSLMERTAHRIARMRDDVSFISFHEPPTPEELSCLHAWADLTMDQHDADGWTAEALASGLVVIATRTTINEHRLEQGRCGFSVPLNDPNEATHAILTALFKTEAAQQKTHAARQTISKFKPRQRVRALLSLYESVRP
jgi:glycosyltransferase involved in cell wall biosynthesis